MALTAAQLDQRGPGMRDNAVRELMRAQSNTNETNIATNVSDIAGVKAQVEAGESSAVVATAGGGTTGLIPATARFAEVTTDDITKQISLPAALAGKRLQILVAATGCELISAVATDKVNNVVVGATAEAALVALTLYTLTYDGIDNWVMTGYTQTAGVEVPVIPDAL